LTKGSPACIFSFLRQCSGDIGVWQMQVDMCIADRLPTDRALLIRDFRREFPAVRRRINALA
jgi:hypothetical protein